MTDFPQEIRKPTMLANWRVKEAKKRVSSAQRREGNDAAYLVLLRQLPCVVTRVAPAGEVHHLKGGEARNERGIGMRATDKWGIPLSHAPHMDLESYGSRREHEWFIDHGVADPYGMAKALYAAPRTIEALTAIIRAHWEDGIA